MILPLERLTAKAKWADKQIVELDRLLKAEFPGGHSPKYPIRSEDDLTAGERTYYCDSVPDIPIDVSLLAGDVLQNLRSSLDHLACHLVEIAGNEVSSQTCFPIADTADEYMAKTFRRKIKGMRQDAIDAIDTIKPYKSGNDTLWHLHKLNNIDKHRLLLTACSTNRARSMTPSEKVMLTEFIKASHPGAKVTVDLRGAFRAVPLVPLEAGKKLYTVSHSELEKEVEFLIAIAFNEPKIIECRPIVEVLNEFSNMVTGIILNFNRDGLL